MDNQAILGVIGGSGLYDMDGLEDVTKHIIETPFGKPSSPIITGTIEGIRIAFLARHGIGHHITPSEVPYLANIYGLKSMGVERIISVSACGSLKEEMAPGHIVIPDQVFDNTHHRTRTFFGDGLVAHIGVAEPFCRDLSSQLRTAITESGGTVHDRGTYITIEGPRFSTKAESNIYRSWGVSIVGMTASPEVFLAREAEICYATMAHVTDYYVWHDSEEPVSVEIVFQTLNKNTDLAKRSIRTLLKNFRRERDCECKSALQSAIVTSKNLVPADTLKKLKLLTDKYL